MKFDEKNPPRTFTVGADGQITISDCGSVDLQPNEQITLKTEAGAEYDVARKDWGFYATPSLNGRLQQFNLRGVLIKNRTSNRFYVHLVEKGKEDVHKKYMDEEGLDIICWLDNDEVLRALEEKMKGALHE